LVAVLYNAIVNNFLVNIVVLVHVLQS
jgi:hypothetical protein